ncbi:MAG TPA: vanadium-dependent haloperoxidase [Steroidobacteraceae bacterium]|nr:vanadium-dependent haloperoxidase [Steroidobacteraceae bacterium]
MSLNKTWFVAAAANLMLLSPSIATAADTDPTVVIEWNQTLQATIGGTGGPAATRWYAAMHIAQFDAMNSIARQYTPFHTRVGASSGASLEAAAAQAAHDVIYELMKNQPTAATALPAYDALLAAQLARISQPGLRAQGVAVGKAVAAKILEWRLNDGATGAARPYSLPAIAGLWQTTGAPVGLTHVPYMLPFTLETNTQFLPHRFPEINTAAYAEDYNEVRLIGSKNSATRSAEQTQTAKLFAAVEITTTNIFVLWNNVVRDVVLSQHLTLLQAARQYAMTNALLLDGLMTSQSGKFIYALWRPVTAINSQLDDLNPDTAPEPNWEPLIGTPPYPSYPGNMACVGAVAARSLEQGLGLDPDKTHDYTYHFSVTWKGATGFPDVTRHYTSFWALALQEADSRIYAGIHFRFDNDVSQEYCPKVADHAFATVAIPR